MMATRDDRAARVLPLIEATRENIAPYGLLIGNDIDDAGLAIPFYTGSVIEGHNLPFVYERDAVLRMARIGPRPSEVLWLERHVRTTQLFLGLGAEPFRMVLGKPTHERGMDVPDLDELATFALPPGHGVMLHRGTWHDFPMTVGDRVTILTASSAEVVETLASTPSAIELSAGDVFKIDVARRLGVRLFAPESAQTKLGA